MVEILVPFAGVGFRPAVTAVLLEISTVVEVKGGNRTQYLFRRRDGSLFSFLAVLDLDRIIQPTHVGHWMVIKLDAYFASPEFAVCTSKGKTMAARALFATAEECAGNSSAAALASPAMTEVIFACPNTFCHQKRGGMFTP